MKTVVKVIFVAVLLIAPAATALAADLPDQVQTAEVAAASVEPARPGTVKRKPVSGINMADPFFLAPDGTMYVTAATTFTIRAVGGETGIARTEYRIDNGQWTDYKPFKVDTEGAHIIEYRSVDNAGTVESIRSLPIYVDLTPPLTAAFVDGKIIAPGAPALTGKKSTITLEGTDAGSGIEGSEYRINDGPWTSYAPFTITGKGRQTVSFRSRDRLGNTEEEKMVVVTSDKSPIRTSISVGDPKHVFDGVTYVSDKTPFTLTVESMSGVTGTEFRIDKGGWKPYTPFTVSGDGQHLISYRSTDGTGKTETARTLAIVVDMQPPVTDLYVGETKQEPSGTAITDGIISFSLRAADKHSSIKFTEYRINDGQWSPYAPFQLEKEGKYRLDFRSADVAGNVETTRSFTAIVDRTAPVAEIVAGSPSKVANGVTYVNRSTVLTPKGDDVISGIDRVEYWINGREDGHDTVPFSLETPGKYRIEYQAVDRAGNRAERQTMLVEVDNTMNFGNSSAPLNVPVKAAAPGGRRFAFTNKSATSAIIATGAAAAAVRPLPFPAVPNRAAVDFTDYDDLPKTQLAPAGDSRDPFADPLMSNRSNDRKTIMEYLTFGLVHVILILGVML